MRRKGAAADVRIGVSGWTYAPWRGAFYPEGLPRNRQLHYASVQFRTLEINGTFYRLQTPDVYARWAAETPDDFVFGVKGSRYITHMRRLRDVEVPLANFLASGVLRLGAKLGPMLWQLPPNFRFEADPLRVFLSLLPRSTQAAVHLARRHDDRPRGQAWLGTDADRPLRHALEIRHESFRDPAFIDLLRELDVALVIADTVAWPCLMDLTSSDLVYCRLHGSTELYHSGYDDAELDRWARRVCAWSTGKPMRDGDFADGYQPDTTPREVFFFFDNTDKLRAPEDARALMSKLAQKADPRAEQR